VAEYRREHGVDDMGMICPVGLSYGPGCIYANPSPRIAGPVGVSASREERSSIPCDLVFKLASWLLLGHRTKDR
jgi:hypothetical protein